MKISKASWTILGIGIFIIALAGLGLARSGQLKEQDNVNKELSLTGVRLNNLPVTQYQTQINELQQQLQEAQDQADEAKNRLTQKIISVDTADKFYEIANYYGVLIVDIGTTSVVTQPYASLNCDTISLNADVTGSQEDIIKFICGLNNDFSTGFVRSVQVTNSDNATSTVNVQMVVYSYKGS